MKKFTVIVEIKGKGNLPTIREEISFEADNRDQATRLIHDSFPGDTINIEFINEQEVP